MPFLSSFLIQSIGLQLNQSKLNSMLRLLASLLWISSFLESARFWLAHSLDSFNPISWKRRVHSPKVPSLSVPLSSHLLTFLTWQRKSCISQVLLHCWRVALRWHTMDGIIWALKDRPQQALCSSSWASSQRDLSSLISDWHSSLTATCLSPTALSQLCSLLSYLGVAWLLWAW